MKGLYNQKLKYYEVSSPKGDIVKILAWPVGKGEELRGKNKPDVKIEEYSPAQLREIETLIKSIISNVQNKK